MKTKILLLLCFFALTACKKKTVEPPIVVAESQNPLEGFLLATGFNQKVISTLSVLNFEFGLSFKPLVNGKMTELVVKLPTANPSLRVSIWNKATSTLIRTELIAVNSSGTQVIKVISPIDLVRDKEYFISFNSKDYYNYTKTDNGLATYPVTVGDILITSYAFRTGVEQVMPTEIRSNYYSGDLSFKFQK